MKTRTPNKIREEFEKWYLGQYSTYDNLAKKVENIIEQVLSDKKIPYLSVNSRTKTVESAVKKIKTKLYSKPIEQMTDLAGIRVLTYSEDDNQKAIQVISNLFELHDKDSIDKSKSLKADKIGYRSTHLICNLGTLRCELQEFNKFKGRKFEVQVRTILQHAWAEFSHSHNYKFAGVLPQDLRRKLNLISGQLEIADSQITSLSREIDTYQAEVKRKASKGDFHYELNSVSVNVFFSEAKKHFKKSSLTEASGQDAIETIIMECSHYGLKTTHDLTTLLTKKFITSHDKHIKITNVVGLIRDLMIFNDIHKYFKQAFANHWQSTDGASIGLWAEKYPRSILNTILAENNVSVDDHLTIQWDKI